MFNIERHMRECETFTKQQHEQQRTNTCEIEAAIVDIETIADQRPIPQKFMKSFTSNCIVSLMPICFIRHGIVEITHDSVNKTTANERNDTHTHTPNC